MPSTVLQAPRLGEGSVWRCRLLFVILAYSHAGTVRWKDLLRRLLLMQAIWTETQTSPCLGYRQNVNSRYGLLTRLLEGYEARSEEGKHSGSVGANIQRKSFLVKPVFTYRHRKNKLVFMFVAFSAARL
jgi:hypothetical protein